MIGSFWLSVSRKREYVVAAAVMASTGQVLSIRLFGAAQLHFGSRQRFNWTSTQLWTRQVHQNAATFSVLCCFAISPTSSTVESRLGLRKKPQSSPSRSAFLADSIG